MKICSDSMRLEQILFNLISNGIKYTPKGKITLHSTYLKNYDLILFTVSDTGYGIDDKKI